MFANVSALLSQSNANGAHTTFPFPDDNNDPQGKRKTDPNSAVQSNGVVNDHPSEAENHTDSAIDELNAVRLREITSKAVSGILLMLLKWFRLSRKFAIMTFLFWIAHGLG